MLTQTSISALRILAQMAKLDSLSPVPPQALAEATGESPSYAAKVTQMLTRAGVLRSHRGVKGGVTLARPLREVSLLNVVEACQGVLLGNFCSEGDDVRDSCAYHQATVELHEAIVGILSKWTVADLVSRPEPIRVAAKIFPCFMTPEIAMRCRRPQRPNAVPMAGRTPTPRKAGAATRTRRAS